MAETGTVMSGILGAILGAAEANGVSAPALKSALGVSALPVATGSRIGIAGAKRVLNVAASMARNATLPVVAGGGLSCSGLDVMGFMMLTAEGRDLGEIMQFQALVSEPSVWRLDEARNVLGIVHQGPAPESAADRLWEEAELTSILTGLRDAFGSLTPLRVSFRHRAPASVSAHRASYRCPLEFGADRTEIVLAAELAARPGRLANRAMYRYFREHAAVELASLHRSVELPDRVRQLVLSELASGDVTCAGVARRLGVGERTLRRRLAARGSSFHGIVTEVRRGVAERLLEDGERSVTEVGMLLGFSETSAFSRAFRRMTGHSPSERRRRDWPKRTTR